MSEEPMEELKLALCFFVIVIVIFLPRNLKLLRFIVENEGRKGFGGMNWFDFKKWRVCV